MEMTKEEFIHVFGVGTFALCHSRAKLIRAEEWEKNTNIPIDEMSSQPPVSLILSVLIASLHNLGMYEKK